MRILRTVLASFLVAAALAVAAPQTSVARVAEAVAIAPPPLPVYAQPPIPGPGYIWIPGYWAWGPDGYYWVPGTWVLPPAVGLLWTPGYWAWSPGGFVFNIGFWGPLVGFYGGIDYGFGYFGIGYVGGYWSNGTFYYNAAVNNIRNTRITNVYYKNITINRITNVSYNGGPGGIDARPTPAELAVARERRFAPTPEQVQHERAAAANRALLASVNHGRPPIAATPRPGEFTGRGVVAARGAAELRPLAAPHRPAATPERVPPGQAEQRRVGQERALPPHVTEERTAPRPVAPERVMPRHVAPERVMPRPVAPM